MRFQAQSVLLAVCLCIAGCGATHSAAPTTSPTTYREADELKAALSYLASDELEGRGLDTQGIDKAADYIASQFRQAKLSPAPGLDGYFQPVQIALTSSIGKATALSVNGQPLTLETDFLPLGMSAEQSFSGSVAFVGYSITNPEKNYDDYASIDVKGKIAVALRYEPADEKEKSRFSDHGYSEHATFAAKAKNAADHGAVALLVVNPARDNGADQLVTLKASTGEKIKIPIIHISRATLASLLQQAGSTTQKELQSQFNTTFTPHSFDLKGIQISGTVEIDRPKKQFRNVVAYLPGKGRHPDECIVVGAHYDHLGRGEQGSLAPNSHKIHNGADDNGSGTVALIELAAELARHGALERSVLFVAFVGEERGLLGSAHFVAHPPVPLDKMIAMVNLDMVGRVKKDLIFVGGNGTAESFDRIISLADKQSPLTVKNAGTDVGGKGGIGPSDQTSFALKKVPVMFLWSGMHADYHRPTDKADKINYIGIAQVVDFTEILLKELAVMPR